MTKRFRALFSAAADIGSPPAATPPAQPEVLRPEHAGQTLMVMTKGPDGKVSMVTADGKPAAPIPQQPPAIQYNQDMWQQKEGLPQFPEPQAPAPAPAQTPAAPEPAQAPPSNDGYLIVRDPGSGQIITRVKADQAADHIFNDKVYIHGLHQQIAELKAARMAPPPPAPSPEPPKPAFNPNALKDQFLPLAQKAFGGAIGPDGSPVDVNPIAEFVASAVGTAVAQAVAPYEAKIGELTQANQNAALTAQIASEFAEIQQYDPRFKLEDPGVQRMHQMYPNESPKQIHARLIQAEYLESRRNPQPAATPAPATPAQPQSQIIQPDPKMFAAPSGGAGQGPSQWDTHPEVQANVAMHLKTHPNASPEAIARVKAFAIQSIQSRSGNGPGQAEGVNDNGQRFYR